jgi:hypothetical protein
MKTIIHVCTLSLLLFNMIWGVYLMIVTYKISAGLFGFAIVGTLLPCLAAALYLRGTKLRN